MMRMGYHLTSVQTDTIIDTLRAIVPNSEADEIQLTLKGDNFFESGKFSLTPESIDSIHRILKNIDENRLPLISITIESSTDKQRLSTNLQSTLSNIGYDSNNQGLSQARNDVVRKVLDESGIDSSIIKQTVLFERGKETIDDTARYVKVIFDVIDFSKDVTPATPEIEKKYIQTFNVIKVLTKHKKDIIRTPPCKKKLKNYKKDKPSPYKCYAF